MIIVQYFKYIYLYSIYFKIISCLNIKSNDKVIISLTSDLKSILNTKIVINSIIEQNIERYFYDIILILSSYDFENISQLPYEFQLFQKNRILNIFFIKDNLTEQKRTLITMHKYQDNPILIVNNLCSLPNGWLEMFLNDHIKYPEDAIVASVEFFFGKNYEIKEFSEGYKGKKFGTFKIYLNFFLNSLY